MFFISGLLRDYTCTFARGHLGVILLCANHVFPAYSRNWYELNGLPLPVLITLGIPYDASTLSNAGITVCPDTDRIISTT